MFHNQKMCHHLKTQIANTELYWGYWAVLTIGLCWYWMLWKPNPSSKMKTHTDMLKVLKTSRLQETSMCFRLDVCVCELCERARVKKSCYLRLCCTTPRARSPACPGSAQRWFLPLTPPPAFHTETQTQQRLVKVCFDHTYTTHICTLCPIFHTMWACHLHGGGHVSLLFIEPLIHFEDSVKAPLLAFYEFDFWSSCFFFSEECGGE